MREHTTIEKWAVLVHVDERMGQFTDEELVTFAKVLAVYTIPDGEPIEPPNAEIVTDLLTNSRWVRAFVRVEGVTDTEATYDQARLYEGATLTPEPERPVQPAGKPDGEPAAPDE